MVLRRDQLHQPRSLPLRSFSRRASLGFLVFSLVPLIFSNVLWARLRIQHLASRQEHSLSTFFKFHCHYLSTVITSTFFTSRSLNHDFCRLTSGLGHDQFYPHHQTFGSIDLHLPSFHQLSTTVISLAHPTMFTGLGEQPALVHTFTTPLSLRYPFPIFLFCFPFFH